MSAVRLMFAATLLWYAAVCSAELNIPSVPAENGEGWFVHDYAGILDDNAMERIGVAQRHAFEKTNVPIIVVTINGMKDYGYEGEDIEPFTQAWFNHWQIGTGTANSGILLLFSKADRKVRIQLGDDWAHRRNSYSQRIIDRDMLPFFREGDFSRGISNGVESLMEMALEDAHSQETASVPANTPVGQPARPALDNNQDDVFPYLLFGVPMGLGVVLMVVGAFSKEKDKRNALLKIGAFLLVLPLGILILLLYFFGAAAGKKTSSSPRSGGFYGGGYRGGSSGSNRDKGGGASGSW